MRTAKLNELEVKNITSGTIMVLGNSLASAATMVVQSWRVRLNREVAHELAVLAGLNDPTSHQVEVRIITGRTLPASASQTLGAVIGFTDNRHLLTPNRIMMLVAGPISAIRLEHHWNNRSYNVNVPIGDPTTPSGTIIAQYEFDIDSDVTVIANGVQESISAVNDVQLVPGIGVDLNGVAKTVLSIDGLEYYGVIAFVKSYQNGDPLTTTEELIAVFGDEAIKTTALDVTDAQMMNAIDMTIEVGRDDQVVSVIPLSRVLVQRNAVNTIVSVFTDVTKNAPFDSLVTE